MPTGMMLHVKMIKRGITKRLETSRIGSLRNCLYCTPEPYQKQLMFAPPGKRHDAHLGRDSPLHFLTAALSSDRLFFLAVGPRSFLKGGGCMKIPAVLLSVVLAGAVFAATPASANQAATEKKD